MKDWSATRIQADALTVSCPYCAAQVGELCVNGGESLVAFPAHEVRIRVAAVGRQEVVK